MNEIYEVKGNSKTEPFAQVVCKDEECELQDLLYNNLALLPKEQLGLKKSAQWLLIGREMPVPSPETGENTWSLDFLLADSEAIPTLVECKRFKDTRSRREVIGQMFEYAANGRSYWTSEGLRRAAEEEDRKRNAEKSQTEVRSLQEMLADHFDGSYEDFFLRLTNNLKSGKMRLIFFLERSSYELRSVVEFLSEQFTGLEVFVVEARQYERDGRRVVVPWVFGYVEAARKVRQEERAAARAIATEEKGAAGFWKTIDKDHLDSPDFDAELVIRDLVGFAEELPECNVLWGRGPRFCFPGRIGSGYLFAIRRGGSLEWNFQGYDPARNPAADETQWRSITGEINKVFGTDYGKAGTPGYPQLKLQQWLKRVEPLKELMKRFSSPAREAAESTV